MIIFITVWLAAMTITATHSLLGLGVSWGLDAKPSQIGVWIGPKLFERRIGRVALRLNWVPIPATYIAFEPLDVDPDSPSAPATHFDLLPAWRRVLVHVLPWAGLLALCVALLGTDALSSTGRAFMQIVRGAVFPESVGAPLIERFVALARSEPGWRFGALFATKVIAFNLLPLPAVAGFQIPFQMLRRSRTPPAWATSLGALAVLALAIGWGWALVAFLT